MAEKTTEKTEYTRWDSVPDNLKTRTQLKADNLRPARGQLPVAHFKSGYGRWKLFDIGQAVPVKPATPERKAQLAAAREKADRLRTCPGYGRHCGEMLTYEDYGYQKRLRIEFHSREMGKDVSKEEWQYICDHCRHRRRAIEWAREVLADERAVILDTETTGLDETAEIVEIAIINTKGETLFNSLVNPHGPMGGTHIHGISAEDVAGAPTWAEVDSEVIYLLQEASRVVVYNSAYDSRLIDQSRNQWGLPDLIEFEPLEKVLVDMEGSSFSPPDITWNCAMNAYAMWYGEYSEYHGSYRWQRLEGGGHRALGDCLACLEYIKRMAGSEQTDGRL